MLSLHPRYPVLKVPAPARLSAAVAQGLIMPEGGPLWAGNIGLHISNTIGAVLPGSPGQALPIRHRALGHLRQQPVEQGEPLRHVRAGRRRPRDHLLAAEVVHRREVRLAPGPLELGDAGARLLPWRVGGEVAP